MGAAATGFANLGSLPASGSAYKPQYGGDYQYGMGQLHEDEDQYGAGSSLGAVMGSQSIAQYHAPAMAFAQVSCLLCLDCKFVWSPGP